MPVIQHWATEWIRIWTGLVTGNLSQSSTAEKRRERRRQGGTEGKERKGKGKKMGKEEGALVCLLDSSLVKAPPLQTVAPYRVSFFNIISGIMTCNLLGFRFSLHNMFLRSNNISNVSALFCCWVIVDYVTLQLLSCEELLMFNFFDI